MKIIYDVNDLVGFDARDVVTLKKQLVDYFSVDASFRDFIVDGQSVIVVVDELQMIQAEVDLEKVRCLSETGHFNVVY